MLDMAFLIKGSSREACGSLVLLAPCELLNPKGTCTKDLVRARGLGPALQKHSGKAAEVTGNFHLPIAHQEISVNAHMAQNCRGFYKI